VGEVLSLQTVHISGKVVEGAEFVGKNWRKIIFLCGTKIPRFKDDARHDSLLKDEQCTFWLVKSINQSSEGASDEIQKNH
jgi:hypothetical protein